MTVHEDWIECPMCWNGGDGPRSDCWWCDGTGWVDPDAKGRKAAEVSRQLEAGVNAKDRRYVECPRCRNLMAGRRETSPRIFCNRCGYLGDGDDLTPFDEDAVKDDPNILTREN